MRTKILIWLLVFSVLISCKNRQVSPRIIKIDADSLIERIDQYIDSRVEIEGTIIHVCGVDRMKMKLKTKNGAIIKIVPQDMASRFENSVLKKKVSIRGKVKEFRVEKPYVDEKEREKTLLCHIDYTPCKDTAWINKQIKTGVADSLSDRDIKKLRGKMEKTGKEYVSVVTIVAERVDVREN